MSRHSSTPPQESLSESAKNEVRLDALAREVEDLKRELGIRDDILQQVADHATTVVKSRRLRIGNAIGDLLYRLRRRRSSHVAVHLNRTLEQIRKLQRSPTGRRSHASTRPWQGIGLANNPIQQQRSVTVVIPVYNAHDDVRACLESVVRHHERGSRILLIDDGSTDTNIWPLLHQYDDDHSFITAVQNPANMGYTRTINRGIGMTQNDVILLNSDTKVTRGWVSKLQQSAYSRDDAGTVTPLSNAAGAFSIPQQNVNNPIPLDLSVEEMGELLAFVSERQLTVTPTGNGFCLYIRRDLFDEIGVFDEEHFPQGHGEENDFSMRAAAAGRVNLIDDGCFVYHKRSASFGEGKGKALEVGKKTLETLHPSYKPQIQEWLQNDPLAELRAFLKTLPQHRQTKGGRPTLLYILHDGRGGTRLTSFDLARAAEADFHVLLLTTGRRTWTLNEVVNGDIKPLEERELETEWYIHQPLAHDRARFLVEILTKHSVGLVHARHFLGNAPEILHLCSVLDVPTVVSFHDFYSVCPNTQLIDDRGRYCGGDCNDGPRGCSVNRGWILEIPPLKNAWVHVWRRRVESALRRASAYVTTSQHTRDTIAKHFAFAHDREFSVIEHGRDLGHLPDVARPPVPNEPLRAIVLGALNFPKGTGLLQSILERDGEHRLELHVLGVWPSGFEDSAGNAVLHGRYSQSDLADKVRKIGPALTIVPSICPETFCHALTESWAMGLPVLGADFGAVRDRITKYGGGWLLDPYSPELWLEKLHAIAEDPDDYDARRREALAAAQPTVAEMYTAYLRIYQRAAETSSATTVS
ncbi:MAG: hypothetical protein A2341_04260 [Deltaproteobacteria bacterium RIFOXYB12_FULL_58_9]|nr:MAG: hypothetical protein A2341_04260 [Deltaproteobacteria bacterium RIFOXYB12_FULL_58_9]